MDDDFTELELEMIRRGARVFHVQQKGIEGDDRHVAIDAESAALIWCENNDQENFITESGITLIVTEQGRLPKAFFCEGELSVNYSAREATHPHTER